jgi:hypothetical protein
MPVSAAFDVHRPVTVRNYFERYAVSGLVSPR